MGGDSASTKNGGMAKQVDLTHKVDLAVPSQVVIFIADFNKDHRTSIVHQLTPVPLLSTNIPTKSSSNGRVHRLMIQQNVMLACPK